MSNSQTVIKGPLEKLWKKIGLHAHHGFALPLSSVRTKDSCGIGEFLDLILVIDLCVKNGFDVVQLLPLNDTGSESSPYSAISSCALNPVFLSLKQLPFLDVHPDLKESLKLFSEFNELPKIPFGTICQKKNTFLEKYYYRTKNQFLNDESFLSFVRTHRFLKPYALFKALSKKFHGLSWTCWPSQYKEISPVSFETFSQEFAEEINFYNVLQYLCFKQMKIVKTYAEKKGIFLKGDIPILVSVDSCDVWYDVNLFDLTKSAGAPPDIYSQEGQYWNLPLFRWDKIKADQYRWWNDRLTYASEFYDIYRIDHVVGLFRIYAIDTQKSAQEGFYIPEDPSFWISHGREILEALIQFGSMLPIAEDLGCIPKGVRECLSDLGICGTKVIRWERAETNEKSFIPLNEYPFLSLTTVSTHDSETLEMWWRYFPNDALDFSKSLGLEYHPSLDSSLRLAILKQAHQTPSAFHINLIGEYLALFPDFVYKNPLDERINVPGTVGDHNWTYRIRPFIEDVIENSIFIDCLKTLLETKSS